MLYSENSRDSTYVSEVVLSEHRVILYMLPWTRAHGEANCHAHCMTDVVVVHFMIYHSICRYTGCIIYIWPSSSKVTGVEGNEEIREVDVFVVLKVVFSYGSDTEINTPSTCSNASLGTVNATAISAPVHSVHDLFLLCLYPHFPEQVFNRLKSAYNIISLLQYLY